MSPRTFDPDVVTTRLRHLGLLIQDLDALGDVTTAVLVEDRMLRHAVERILAQLVELAVAVNGHVAATELGEVSSDYRSSFTLAARAGLIQRGLADRLSPSVGLRNVLAHDYVAVDLGVVALPWARHAPTSVSTCVR